MLVTALLALTSTANIQADTYKIVQIDRKTAFAGRLGLRVRENLTVERDGHRYTISVRGDYHTRFVREYQRFKEGDEIRLPALKGDTATIDRDRISRIRN